VYVRLSAYLARRCLQYLAVVACSFPYDASMLSICFRLSLTYIRAAHPRRQIFDSYRFYRRRLHQQQVLKWLATVSRPSLDGAAVALTVWGCVGNNVGVDTRPVPPCVVFDKLPASGFMTLPVDSRRVLPKKALLSFRIFDVLRTSALIPMSC
jgi:hypothetical protein